MAPSEYKMPMLMFATTGGSSTVSVINSVSVSTLPCGTPYSIEAFVNVADFMVAAGGTLVN